MLDIFATAPFRDKMYLTGSRFFQHFALNSDYDYFTNDSYSAREWLKHNGFRLVEDSRYDGDTLAVYERDNIDVQLVVDAKVKSRYQQVIKDWLPWFNTLTKDQQKDVWSAFYNL